jgi:putative two-component system response regulator
MDASKVSEREDTVMIVDDEMKNIQVLGQLLRTHQLDVHVATSGEEALTAISHTIPDLILLDVMMPKMDGYELARRIKARPTTHNTPILFITALSDIDSKVKAFESGGVDFITKPFQSMEVIHRVKTHLELKHYRDDLERQVRERVNEIEQINTALVNSLESANYFKDNDTGMHIKRVSEFTFLIARGMGIDSQRKNEIHRYASLHDIGKVGVPDNILQKPGKLTKEEFDVMARHCDIGFQMVDRQGISSILKNIVRHHHEKWDGSGYPDKLAGEKIPLEAHIVALADVYDALRSERVYKPAFTREKSEEIIMESAGSHFNPEMIEVFSSCTNEINDIFEELKDKTIS